MDVSFTYPNGDAESWGDDLETQVEVIDFVNQYTAILWADYLQHIDAEEPHPPAPRMNEVTDQPVLPRMIKVKR